MSDVSFEWRPEHGVTGKGRPRVLKSGRTYTPLKTKEASAEVVVEWLSHVGSAEQKLYAEYDGPVKMTILYSRELPKSASEKRIQENDLQKPDIDNVAKLIMDALNGYAYKDDSQIVELNIRKLRREAHGRGDIIALTVRYLEWE